jgi:hypothetical protein
LRWLERHPPVLDRARQGLERTIEEGVQAGEIVNGIRALVAKSPPRKEWVDVNKTILEVIDLARGEIQKT